MRCRDSLVIEDMLSMSKTVGLMLSNRKTYLGSSNYRRVLDCRSQAGSMWNPRLKCCIWSPVNKLFVNSYISKGLIRHGKLTECKRCMSAPSENYMSRKQLAVVRGNLLVEIAGKVFGELQWYNFCTRYLWWGRVFSEAAVSLVYYWFPISVR